MMMMMKTYLCIMHQSTNPAEEPCVDELPGSLYCINALMHHHHHHHCLSSISSSSFQSSSSCHLPFEILIVSLVIFVQLEQVFCQSLWTRELILVNHHDYHDHDDYDHDDDDGQLEQVFRLYTKWFILIIMIILMMMYTMYTK